MLDGLAIYLRRFARSSKRVLPKRVESGSQYTLSSRFWDWNEWIGLFDQKLANGLMGSLLGLHTSSVIRFYLFPVSQLLLDRRIGPCLHYEATLLSFKVSQVSLPNLIVVRSRGPFPPVVVVPERKEVVATLLKGLNKVRDGVS